MMQAKETSLLNVQEAASFLRISVAEIYRLTSTKKIPHIKLGKRCVFNPERLLEWAESKAVEVMR